MVTKLTLCVLLAILASSQATLNFTCDFTFKQVAENFGYTCTVIDIQRSEGGNAFHIEGAHQQGRTNSDVTIVDVQVPLKSFHNELFIAFSNLEAVQLYRTGIEVINMLDFFDAINLKFLEIVYGNISTIPQTAFNFARELEVLRFTSSQVRDIEDRAFFGLSKLRELSFYDNQISSFRPDMLNTLTNLRDFSASFNQLERIDGSFFANNRLLENILLQRNEINRIQSNFLDNVVGLKTLVLQGNLCINRNFDVTTSSDLSSIHAGLQICYSNDDMTVTPPATTTQSTTQSTTQATTQTTTPPTTIPPETINLNCEFNWIGSDYSCTLQSLELTNENADYRITGNHFGGWNDNDVLIVRIMNSNVPFVVTQFFDAFPNMRTLQLLASGLGRIRNFDFDKGSSLRTLDIIGSSLRSLEANSFRNLSNLQSLSVNSELLSVINENAFVGLTSLTDLQLEHNIIEDLSRSTLAPMAELQRLSVAHSKIRKISADIFAGNLNLQTINLDNNEIIEVGNGFIGQLGSLVRLKLSGNRCADSSFGANEQFAFEKELIDYELKQCYANVGQSNPIVPEFFQFNCTFTFVNSEYACLLQSIGTSNENAIFRVGNTHFIGWSNSQVDLLRIADSNLPFIVTRLFDLFTNLSRLQLWNSELARIRNSDFENARNLRSISITNAARSFQTLEASSFRNLTRLESLQFSSSSLASISPNAFDGLLNIQELTLDDNYIANVQDGTFAPLINLVSLNLDSNRLSNLSQNIFVPNMQLQTIRVGYNTIMAIDPGFIGHLQQLRELSLTSNLCADSSFGIGARFAFERELIDYELKQCYANLGSPNPIVPEFVNLPCDFNWLGSDYMCTLQNLEVSNDNAIFRVIGNHFGGWNNNDVIVTRIINSNVTFVISRLFTVFPNMANLQLTSSLLSRIRNFDFDNARNLRFVTIVGTSNNWRTLEEHSFRNLSMLETLRVSDGFLDEIHPNAFIGLANLRELRLDNNFIRSLHVDTLRSLTSLQTFNANFNRITRVDVGLFNRNLNLQAIELDGNTIREIEEGFIGNLVALRLLKLSNNICADSSFGEGVRFAFDRELIDYEMKHCFSNVGSLNPIVPEFINLPCDFNWSGSDYMCTISNVFTSNTQAIFRVTGNHFVGWDNTDIRIVLLHTTNGIDFAIPRLFTTFPNMLTYIHNAGIARISANDFANARNLRFIQMAGGRITNLLANSFEHLPNLETLSMTMGDLQTIHTDAFAGLSNLQLLSLASNRIASIGQAHLRELRELRTLNLNNNNLQHLNGDIFANTTGLNFVDIADNQIVSIGSGFVDHLTQLESLRVSDNRCANVNFGPQQTLDLTRSNLDYELRFCHGNIGSPNPIEPSIIPLTCNFNWEGADYSCTLQNIQVSSENTILRVGGIHFGGWNNNDVRVAQFINSNVTFIASRLFEVFPNLHVYRHTGGIQRLMTTDFVNAGSLLELTIQAAEVTSLESSVFLHLTQLRSLIFSFGVVRVVNENAFEGLTLLEQLDLHGNLIDVITPNHLRHFRELRMLNLGANNIQRISGDLFSNTLQLQTIDLRDNLINAISPNFVNGVDNLRHLILLGNSCASVELGTASSFNPIDRDQLNNLLVNCFNNFNSLVVRGDFVQRNILPKIESEIVTIDY